MNCSFASQESPCSSYGSSTNVLPLDACKEDITPQLLGLGVSSKRGWRSEGIEITEKELILNRAGHFDLSQDRVAAMTICPKHRRDLTVDWRGRKSSTCCYPSQKGQRKQVKDPRRVNYSTQCPRKSLLYTMLLFQLGPVSVSYYFKILLSILPGKLRFP